MAKFGARTVHKIDKKLIRPAEVDSLVADYKKAKNILKWSPNLSFNDLVVLMVESDLKLVKDRNI